MWPRDTLTSWSLFGAHNHVVILVRGRVFGGERWRDRRFSTSLYPSCSDTSGPEAHPQPLGLKNGLTGAAGVKPQTTDVRLHRLDLDAGHWAGFAGGNSRLRRERLAHLWLLMAWLGKCSCDLMEERHTSFSLSMDCFWYQNRPIKEFRFLPALKFSLVKQTKNIHLKFK